MPHSKEIQRWHATRGPAPTDLFAIRSQREVAEILTARGTLISKRQVEHLERKALARLAVELGSFDAWQD